MLIANFDAVIESFQEMCNVLADCMCSLHLQPLVYLYPWYTVSTKGLDSSQGFLANGHVLCKARFTLPPFQFF